MSRRLIGVWLLYMSLWGNKLDRGFTVEGLTVTYMNRPPSDQLDTLEQRARAFGYRGDLLPYCQFFATPRTLKVLREIVDNETTCVPNFVTGLTKATMSPAGQRPSVYSCHRALVLRGRTLSPRWRVSTNGLDGISCGDRPSVRRTKRQTRDLLRSSGFWMPQSKTSGAWSIALLIFHSRELSPASCGRGLESRYSQAWLAPRRTCGLAGSWLPNAAVPYPVLLMLHPGGGPRDREWDSELGFINLMQGADPVRRPNSPWYPGDRALGGVIADPEKVVVQVHRVRSTQPGLVPEVFTLAVHAGRRAVVRKD